MLRLSGQHIFHHKRSHRQQHLPFLRQGPQRLGGSRIPAWCATIFLHAWGRRMCAYELAEHHKAPITLRAGLKPENWYVHRKPIASQLLVPAGLFQPGAGRMRALCPELLQGHNRSGALSAVPSELQGDVHRKHELYVRCRLHTSAQ